MLLVQKYFCCCVHGASCDSIEFLVPEPPLTVLARVGYPHSSGAEAPQAPQAKFASKGGRPVYFWFALSNFLPVRSAVSNAEAHIPTQPSSPFQDARVSFSHEDQERTGGHFPPSRQGTQARRREAGFPRVIA